MNKNMSKLLIIVVAIMSISVFSNSCYDDGDAVVTIHLVRNDLASIGIPHKENFVDKLFNFFITKAEAAPTLWPSSKSDLTLTVSSTAFDTKIFTIPPTATSYTLTLPAGNTATLTITTTGDWRVFDGPEIQKNWGGHITTELKSGNQDITVQMLPMTYITGVGTPSIVSIAFIYEDTFNSMPPSVISYNIYRSSTIDGEYTFVENTTTSPGEDNVLTGRYYYRVSTVCDLGDGIPREGVLCDPKTW